MGASVDFSGFEPSSEVKSLAKKILWKVEADSPSNAAQQIHLSKKRGGFFAEIKISSEAGIFSAHTENQFAEKALKDLHSKIDLKLTAWKKNRVAFS